MSTEPKPEHPSDEEQLARRIDSDKKQIKGLLDELGSEANSLKQSHNSVLTSLTLMLTYIDDIRKSIPEGDIGTLLKTYREMAELFYTKFEYSLLEQIKKQRDIREQSKAVIEYIRKLQQDDPGIKVLTTVGPILAEDQDAADIEYKTLIENFPTLLQRALDKLRIEWERLNSMAVASKALTEDNDLIETLKVVVTSAGFSIGIEAERIAIVPGDAFAVNSFTYLTNFAVLTVPIYSVQAPWEWSIFWHELATYQVGRLQKDSSLKLMRTNLENLYKWYHEWYKLQEDFQQGKFAEDFLPGNIFIQNYLTNLFNDPQLVLTDLGNFEDQFEQMLGNLPKENQFRLYDQLKADGWCADWLKELFEDAWSVLTIGKDFLITFEDILKRHAPSDARHPKRQIRLAVARKLLELSESAEVKPPTTVEESAAQQILKLMSLVMSSAYSKYIVDEKTDLKVLMELLIRMLIIQRQQAILDKVTHNIREAIASWNALHDESYSRKALLKKSYSWKTLLEAFEQRNDPKAVNEGIDMFAGVSDKEFLDQIEGTGKNKIAPDYLTLLVDKDYKQLLGLSFFERDFGFPSNKICKIILGTGIKAVKTAFVAIADTIVFEMPAKCLVTGTLGDIVYDLNNVTYCTTVKNWNDAFVLHPEYEVKHTE